MYTECRHIMPSGKKCHSPALNSNAYCYHHNNLHLMRDPNSKEAKEIPLPALEDASGIQLALTQVLGALNSPFMDTRRAGLLLYGLQIAIQLTSRVSAPEPADAVREVTCESNGDVLAPEKSICEPPADCSQCSEWESCEDVEKADEQ